jgi:hypothetical protein
MSETRAASAGQIPTRVSVGLHRRDHSCYTARCQLVAVARCRGDCEATN